MSNDAGMSLLVGSSILVFVFALVSSCIAVVFALAIQTTIKGEKPNWVFATGGVLGGSILTVLLFVVGAKTGTHIGWPIYYAPLVIAILPWIFLRGRFMEVKAALSACIMGAFVGMMFFTTQYQ